MSTENTFAPPQNFFHELSPVPKFPAKSQVAVIGAGAFGGWSAIHLLRRGFKVSLIDAWGAGNSRGSSGDETRVIRSTYGANEQYFDLNVRALELWKESQQRWNKKLFYNTGVLWMCYEEKTPMVDDSVPFARKHKMEYEYLSKTDIQKRFPAVKTTDLNHGWFDPFGGYLKARESCQVVAEAFVNEGGKFIQAHVKPGAITNGNMQQLELSNGQKLQADIYLFACGSWLGKVFPKLLGNFITCTRQEAYYFGVPENLSTQFDNMPVWVDVDGKDFYYGIPGNASRGFKIGVDRRGEKFDPTHGNRILNPAVLQHARAFIEHRFPALKNAPLVENRVCPYESSPDGNFLFSGHTEAKNVVLLGGGSGHGFKHGPALGELVANKINS
jgi:glycine/D-amino acid oxidase-like deaminating enzyme